MVAHEQLGFCPSEQLLAGMLLFHYSILLGYTSPLFAHGFEDNMHIMKEQDICIDLYPHFAICSTSTSNIPQLKRSLRKQC